MDFCNLARQRRSIREYTEQPISTEDFNTILSAGLLAPSSRNRRPVELVAVRDRDTLAALSRCKTAGASMLEQADGAIVVLGDTVRSDVWIEDASVVMTYLQLQAADLGIGSCWVQCRLRFGENAACEENVRKVLGIPDHFAVEAILSLGMPASRPEPRKVPLPDGLPIHWETF